MIADFRMVGRVAGGETKTTSGGRKYAIVKVRCKNARAGQPDYEFEVTFWQRVEAVENELRTGVLVLLEGLLQTREWKDRHYTQLVGSGWEIIAEEYGGGSVAGVAQPSAEGKGTPAEEAGGAGAGGGGGEVTDDLPF